MYGKTMNELGERFGDWDSTGTDAPLPADLSGEGLMRARTALTQSNASQPPRCIVIYGSQSGNTALVAEAISARLAEHCFQVELLDGTNAGVAALAVADMLILCTSSHGHGELPDNLVGFHASLVETQPDLSHLEYSVIAIGDTTYSETFCFAGATMYAALAAAGARPVEPLLQVDVSVQIFAEEPALGWLEHWMARHDTDR